MPIRPQRSDSEREALKASADTDGISMQEAAREAVRDFVARRDHRDRVAGVANLIMDAHRNALRRLRE